jgi:hypothetical protein
MSKDDKVFLRVPVILSNGSQGFVDVHDVDLSRLSPATFKEVFITSRFIKGPAKPQRLVVDDSSINLLDVSKLIEIIEDVLVAGVKSDLDGILEDKQDKSDEVSIRGAIECFEKLKKVFEHLSHERVGASNDEFLEFAYTIRSLLGNLAKERIIAVGEAEAMAAAHDHIQNALKSMGNDLVNTHYLEWALNVDELLNSATSLSDIELKLLVFEDRVVRGMEMASAIVARDNEAIEKSVIFLSDGPNNFINQSVSFLSKPVLSRDDIQRLIDRAHNCITTCRGKENEAKQIWENLRKAADEEISPLRDEIEKKCSKLKEVTEILKDYNRRYPQDAEHPVPRPFEVVTALSKEEWDRSQVVLRDTRWGPMVALRRMREIIGRIYSLIESPAVLDDGILMVFSQSENLIVQIENSLLIEVEVKEEKIPEFLKSERLRVAKFNQDIDPKRLLVLYELINCTGYFLTCYGNKGPLTAAATSVRSMLRVVQYLDLCSAEEVEIYSLSLIEMMFENNQVERLVGPETCRDRWGNSTARWICYIPKIKNRKESFKMTWSGRQVAINLMQRNSLTVEQIKDAYEAKKADDYFNKIKK